MPQYYVGVRVECLANKNEGKSGTITHIIDGMYYVEYDDCSTGCSTKPEKYYKIIPGCKTNNAPAQKMSLISKLMLSLKSEPEKSFIKAGITQASGEFTCEGKELFINWLFQDEATRTKFNTEVAQPILEQIKEDKDCGK